MNEEEWWINLGIAWATQTASGGQGEGTQQVELGTGNGHRKLATFSLSSSFFALTFPPHKS